MKCLFYLLYVIVAFYCVAANSDYAGIILSMFLVGLFLMLQPAHWKKKEKEEPEDESKNKE